MEILLHYCWKHKMLPLGELKTTDGHTVEVIDPGLHNRHAGPDFFNAKIRINGTLWVGNVEIHEKSSDWYLHGHDRDKAYDNVILHVATTIDTDVRMANGLFVPQMQLVVPDKVKEHYEELLSIDQYPPCYQIIPSLTRLMVHSWMSALQTERLEQKTEAIRQRVQQCEGSWEAGYFVTLARNFGFGVNGDAFELWARNVPLKEVAHHRDDLFQIEAIFMGQAGLLEIGMIPERYQKDALQEGYFTRLRREYLYLQHKFSLKPMDGTMWKFLRLRPQNFPHIRIAQLATLYYERRAGLSQLIACETTEPQSGITATERVSASELKWGQRLVIRWLPDRRIVVKHQGDGHFVVMESEHSKLNVGDTFVCHLMLQREPLYLDQLVHDNMPPTTYVAGQRNGVTIEICG